MEFLKFLGKNAKNKFYARDFRNNYRFRPDVNPPRVKFEGYVNFVFNRNLASFLDMENHTYKTNITSLVRRANLPQVTFRNQVRNQYNKKRIVTTGVEYAPVSVSVFDTINNEWLQILMRYFSYLFMNPRNKNSDGDRDIHFYTNSSLENINAGFTSTSFKSGEAGFNLQRDKQFFERIDIIMYHGKRGVQYSMTNPIINNFNFGDMDYASNEAVEFTIEFDYENFTTYDLANFELTPVDLDRFEMVNGLRFQNDEVLVKPLGIVSDPIDMQFLGEHTNDFGTRGRTAQPQADLPKGTGNDTSSENSSTDQTSEEKGGTTPTISTYGAIDDAWSLDPNDGIGKGLLQTALLAKMTGNDVGDALKNYALQGLANAASDKLKDVQNAPERGSEPESSSNDSNTPPPGPPPST